MPIALNARLRTLVAAATVAVLGFSGLVVLGSPQAASAATGTITGSAFRDFNANGLFDTTATPASGVAVDTGLTGVTVTAYDANNTAVGSTVVSAANGSYTLTATNAITSRLRVEFSTLPAGLNETPVYSTGGARTGTSVQFVAIGATNVNFGAGVPADYSQNNPPVITAIQYAGIPTSTSATRPAVVGQAYNTSVTSGSTSTGAGAFPGRTTLATFSQVGAVWGTAYRAPQNDLLLAATYKRHSGLGTLGLGGIYRVTDVVTNGAISTTGTTVVPWINVADPAGLNINVGTALDNATRGITAGNVEARDPDAFAKAGKIGIGGMAVSADGSLLYFVNLFDKSLYTINISNLASPSIVAVTPLGLTTGQRPWALTMHNGSAYVGYVTTGETLVGGVETANPGISAATAALTANVIRTALPLTAASTFTPVLTGNTLGYAKGDVYSNTLVPQSHRWNTWADTWNWTGGSVGQAGGGWHIYPSPVLTALYFDESNYLTLGFADRTAMQGGNRNHSSVTGDTAHYETGSSGDVLIASPNVAGTSWAMESNGAAGTRTAGTAARTTNNEGPGTGEFYGDSMNQNVNPTHQEVALGALTGVRGTREVISTQYDPLAGIRLAGLGWLSTANGNAVGGYEETADPGDADTTAPAAGTFQKGGGMASVQVLAEEAPLEIGNRVWFDADQDGTQDADEPALSGVTVELRQGATLLDSMVTGADGTYYFSSDSDSPFYAAGFAPNGGTYTVSFVKPSTGNVAFVGADATTFGTVAWSALTPTSADVGSDTIDSDISAVGTVTYTAGASGTSDHTIDAGYSANASFTVSKAISAGGGTPTSGQTFSIVATAVDFRGNPYVLGSSPFTLTGGSSSGAISVPAGTRVTVTEANGGLYRSNAVSPSGATLVTTGAPVGFTVTNELFEPGRFSISKSVTGPAASSVASGHSFSVTYTYPGQSSPQTLTVTNGGTSALSTPIPYGTVVTLSEIAPTGAPANVGWSTPTWAELAGGGAVTDNGDGTASITIDDNSTLSVGLTNPTTVVTGGFSVTKVIGADAAASVPSSFAFTVRYRLLPAGAWTNLVVTKAAPTATVTGIPAGTTVEIEELAPGTAAPDVQWGTPVFSGNVSTTGGVTTFVVPANATEPVTLTNPTTRLYGSFTLTKDVTGGAESSLTAGHDFTVNYSYTDMPGTGIITVENGQLFTSENIPLGTNVTITEVTPTGGLPTGSTYGLPVLHIGATTLVNGSVIQITDATPIVITLENPTVVTPAVSILRGDQVGPTYHAADTIATGEVYAPGSTRDIVIEVTNTGTDELENVVLGDVLTSGNDIDGLEWTFPDGTVISNAGASTQWPNSFDGTSTWAPGAVIIGRATLMVALGDQPHIAAATVEAVGVHSGTAVDDANDYNAFTGGIQVIKYDGNLADPAITDGGGANVTPTKADVPDGQDADTTGDAVVYPVSTPQDVRLVVTNTGTTTLTNLSLADVTSVGPNVDSAWRGDLSAFGGPANFNFAGGAQWGGVLRPGESFYAWTTLTLAPMISHSGEVTVVGTIVVPELDVAGVPNGEPTLDAGGDPVVALIGGAPATVTDDDPFNARTGTGPSVDLELGDGSGTAIVNDADTMDVGEAYLPGETRTVVFTLENTGDEALRNVVVTDEVFSGADLGTLVWTFPDGSTETAVMVGGVLRAEWPASITGTASWAPGVVITGVATLRMDPADPAHVNVATVTANGLLSNIPVTATDPYNAFTGAVQIIEYDGNQTDPIVKDGSGNWVIPTKPAVPTGQDADTSGTAVVLPANLPSDVRWVVTNTGTTWLTDITLVNTLTSGTPVGASWTADLSPVGGPSAYNFATSGPWTGMLAPGESFFAHGTLTLAAGASHANTATVTGRVIEPEVDLAGLPTGGASVDVLGNPQLASFTGGGAFIVTASDPFNARVLAALARSGTDSLLPLLLGFILLLIGLVAMLYVSRRRRQAE